MTATALQIGRLGGVRIRLDVSFLLVLPFLAWAFAGAFGEAARRAGIPPERIAGPRWAWGVGVALGLFASVLAHELAHCWALARGGGRARAVTLLMIGGVTEVAQPTRDLRREWVVALAGPALSLALGVLAAGAGAVALRVELPSVAFALAFAARINIALGAFNLLPAFPMDGGRVLRSLLARRRSPVEATRIAADLGKAVALALAAIGLVSANILLVLVAFFVYVGAHAEHQEMLVRTLLGDLRVRDIMTAHPSAVAPGDRMFDVAERLVRERRVVLPVVDDGRVLGIVRVEAAERLSPAERRATAAREAMEPVPMVAPDAPVLEALRRLGARVDHLAVVEDGRLVGVVSSHDVSRGLRLRGLAASQRDAAAHA